MPVTSLHAVHMMWGSNAVSRLDPRIACLPGEDPQKPFRSRFCIHSHSNGTSALGIISELNPQRVQLLYVSRAANRLYPGNSSIGVVDPLKCKLISRG